MNRLRLKEVTQKHVIYFYHPEGNGSYGEVCMNFSDKRPFIISRSDEDTNTNWYAFMAMSAVEKCVKRQDFPLEFTQAWY